MRYAYRNDGTLIPEVPLQTPIPQQRFYAPAAQNPRLRKPPVVKYWVFLIIMFIFQNIIALVPMYFLYKVKTARTQYDVDRNFRYAKIGCAVTVATLVVYAILACLALLVIGI